MKADAIYLTLVAMVVAFSAPWAQDDPPPPTIEWPPTAATVEAFDYPTVKTCQFTWIEPTPDGGVVGWECATIATVHCWYEFRHSGKWWVAQDPCWVCKEHSTRMNGLRRLTFRTPEGLFRYWLPSPDVKLVNKTPAY